MGEKWPVNFACSFAGVFLHAANRRHGADGFTSLPKEGMLWIFSNPAEAGFEPAILGTRGQHANHYTTEAANMQNY
jgi:hypothetical protein